MLRVILIGYGELASSLMLGVLESPHKLVGILRWEKAETNKLFSAVKDTFYPDNFTSLVKAYKVHQIEAQSANSEDFRKKVLRLHPDVILVGSWGEILRKETIILPRVGCVNCHPSLLPKHRGSNPYTSAIRYGETKSGITFHLVDEGIDSGPILLQKEVIISEDDTGESLRRKCAYKARESVKDLLDGLENAQLLPRKQDESKATYFPRICSEDAKINWNKPAQTIHNQIRGLYPWIMCYTKHNSEYLKIKTSRIIELDNYVKEPGKVLAKQRNGLIISTSDPDKALYIGNLELYGTINKLFSNSYISKNIRIGDFLEKV